MWAPPITILSEANPKPTVPREMISSLHVAGVKIVLEETPLDSLQSRFGGAIGHEGDAGDYLEWLCLTGGDVESSWILWLGSAEVDGGNVGSLRWQRVSPTANIDSRCAHISSAHPVAMPLPFRLGVAEQELLRDLGSPSFRKGNELTYVHEHDLSIQNEPYTSTNTVSVILQRGVIWALEIEKSTIS